MHVVLSQTSSLAAEKICGMSDLSSQTGTVNSLVKITDGDQMKLHIWNFPEVKLLAKTVTYL